MKKIEKILVMIITIIIIIWFVAMTYICLKLALFNKCNMQRYDENFNYNWCNYVRDF